MTFWSLHKRQDTPVCAVCVCCLIPSHNALIFLVSFVLVGQVACSDATRGERELVRARIESLENALIMKYIQYKVAQIQAMEFCNPDRLRDKNEYALTEPQIKSLVNNSKKRTYIYVSYQFTADNKELYTRSDGKVSGEEHAEDIMFTALNEVPPLEYWINNSPCPCCAVNLISRYSAADIPDNTSKTIKFIKFYTLPPKVLNAELATMLSLQCMAKMIHHGFKFEPWDWEKFGDNLASDKCKETLNKEINEEETAKRLKEARLGAIEAIKKANKLAQTKQENELCTLNDLKPLIDKKQCKLS